MLDMSAADWWKLRGTGRQKMEQIEISWVDEIPAWASGYRSCVGEGEAKVTDERKVECAEKR